MNHKQNLEMLNEIIPQKKKIQSPTDEPFYVNTREFLGIRSKHCEIRPFCERDKLTTIECRDEFDNNGNELFATESFGLEGEVTKIIAEGWLQKKGTGKDWIGSKSWKPRWVQIVLAKVETCDIDIPLLLVYWNASMPKPSNIINLVSKVIIPLKNENICGFDVVHVGNSENGDSSKTTRTFSATHKECNEWVQMINSTLHDFEKRRSVLKVRRTVLRAPIRKIDVGPFTQQTISSNTLIRSIFTFAVEPERKQCIQENPLLIN